MLSGVLAMFSFLSLMGLHYYSIYNNPTVCTLTFHALKKNYRKNKRTNKKEEYLGREIEYCQESRKRPHTPSQYPLLPPLGLPPSWLLPTKCTRVNAMVHLSLFWFLHKRESTEYLHLGLKTVDRSINYCDIYASFNIRISLWRIRVQLKQR